MNATADLTIDDFRPRLGKTVPVETQSGLFELKVVQVQELPRSNRAAGSFRLEFHGPAQPLLHQATYIFQLGARRCPIFIVPLGPAGPAMRYEAIFY